MKLIVAAGSHTREVVVRAGYTVHLLLRTLAALRFLPRRTRFALDSAYAVGVRALPVTLVVAMFAGMILALQTGIELMRLGQGELIGSILPLAMCREMGPFMTAIILAATVGSAIAAEVGTMKVSDEITALDVMSIDPVNYLVLPRVAAMTVMCPVLTAVSDLVGIAGGSIVGEIHLGISQEFYWSSVREALRATDHIVPKDLYVGLFKAVVFGCAIATVACSSGLRADGGALGVGRAVQQAVMVSIILIIVLGYVITWFFYFLVR